MRKILPYILGTLTQHQRTVVPMVWNPKSFTGTAFASFRYLFGERYGIRRYNRVQYVKGERLVQHFCLESRICYAEQLIREWLPRATLAPFRVRVAWLMTPQGIGFPIPYMLAIATDTSTAWGAGSGTTTVTYANYPMATTATGICFFGMFGINQAGDDVTGQTFNAVSGTKLAVRATGYRWGYMFYFLAATGTHNIVITASDNLGGDSQGSGFSYTGCNVSAIDSSATNSGASTTSVTTSTTVVASNCWLAAICLAEAATMSAGSGTREVQSFASGANLGTFDSNGTVGTGSQSLHMTVGTPGSNGYSAPIASFAPVAVANTAGFFTFF